MVLCLAGRHPVLSIGGNGRRQGLKTTFALLCPRSPGLTPRSLFGYLIVDSLISLLPIVLSLVIAGEAHAQKTLLNVSYDPTRELYKEFTQQR
jgi:hypothetical protein